MEPSDQLNKDQPEEYLDGSDKDLPPAPSKPISRILLRGLFLYLLIPYLFILGLLFFFQRSLIYPGSAGSTENITPSGFSPGQVHDVKIETEDKLSLNGWFVLPEEISARNTDDAIILAAQKYKVIIYFPGNAQTRQERTGGIKDFTQLGFSVLIVDYRGYADNAGTPSEKWIRKDALAQWKYLNETYQIPTENIFIFGESLGGAVSIQTVSDLCKNGIEPAGLVISSSFSSVADVASYHYPYFPIRPILLDQWNSKKEIPNITCPIVILHGQADQIVPIQFGKALFKAAPLKSSKGIAKQIWEIPGGTHNAIPRHEIKKTFKALLQGIK